MSTTESKALRHAFFATRAAAKIPDVPSDTPLRAIKSVAVIGAGTMGGGIAMSFANAGIPVTVLETTQAALDKGLGVVMGNYESSLKKGRLTSEEFDRRHQDGSRARCPTTTSRMRISLSRRCSRTSQVKQQVFQTAR